MSDRKLLIGVGIGMIIATTFMLGVKINMQLSKAEIEKKAYDYGMKYPDDFKVINSKEVGK